MGLAGPKNKTKIGKDPRNTFWTNDTSRFGHKYLESQGWTPGETLGDKSSGYYIAGHITNASTSGVRITLKDDNLGIGAKRGDENECTGLLGLEGLLGRLNGNEKAMEMVAKEEERRKVMYSSAKFGMYFVKGETWRADDILKLREKMVADGTAKEVKEVAFRNNEDTDSASEESSKKRKRDHKENEYSSSRKRSKSKPKKSKRDKSTSPEDESEPGKSSKQGSEPEDEDEKSKSKRRKKEKKRKEKEDKKKEKKSKKSKGKKRKPMKSSTLSSNASSSESEMETKSVVVPPMRAALTGRRAIRARYIAAKRSATMDLRSLNEILMVTA